jgi:hypothetical protein
LRKQGEFRQALAALRRGDELGSRRPGWRYPSPQWVQECQRLVDLDVRLPDFLARKATPAIPAERIELAQVCSLKGLHRAAARFYEEALAAQPGLDVVHRYRAACAAALAGCSQGKDAGELDDKERARLRQKALDWLRADLEAWRRLLDRLPAKSRLLIVRNMQHWRADPAIAGVRDEQALARLPEAERQQWQKLWNDAGDLLARLQAKTTQKK